MGMKVSKRDISILLIALGLIAAFCVYQFYFRGALNKKKAYEDENVTLQQRIDKFNGVDENKLIAEMAKNAQDLQTKAAVYPSAYLYEDLIMYMNEWQELPYDEMYNFPVYKVYETSIDNTISGVIDWDQTNRTALNASYMFGKASIEASYQTNTYKGFKDMVNKIYLDPAPKTIQTISAGFSADTGYISGSIKVNFRNVNSQDGTNVYVPVEINDVKQGVECIFGPTNTPTPTPTPSVAPTPRVNNND